MLRNALVYEELTNNIETGTLFLLKGAPRAWLAPGKQIRVERMNTYFGDLSFTVDTDENRTTAHIVAPKGKWSRIDIDLSLPTPAAPAKVTVNGKPHADFDKAGHVRLAGGKSDYTVEVQY